MVPIEKIWKVIWTNYSPLEDTSQMGVEKDEVLNLVLSGGTSKDPFTKQIAQFWIGRCLPQIFTNFNTLQASCTNSNHFALKKNSPTQIQDRQSNVPPIPQGFKEQLKTELLAVIRQRKGSAPEKETLQRSASLGSEVVLRKRKFSEISTTEQTLPESSDQPISNTAKTFEKRKPLDRTTTEVLSDAESEFDETKKPSTDTAEVLTFQPPAIGRSQTALPGLGVPGYSLPSLKDIEALKKEMSFVQQQIDYLKDQVQKSDQAYQRESAMLHKEIDELKNLLLQISEQQTKNGVTDTIFDKLQCWERGKLTRIIPRSQSIPVKKKKGPPVIPSFRGSKSFSGNSTT